MASTKRFFIGKLFLITFLPSFFSSPVNPPDSGLPLSEHFQQMKVFWKGKGCVFPSEAAYGLESDWGLLVNSYPLKACSVDDEKGDSLISTLCKLLFDVSKMFCKHLSPTEMQYLEAQSIDSLIKEHSSSSSIMDMCTKVKNRNIPLLKPINQDPTVCDQCKTVMFQPVCNQLFAAVLRYIEARQKEAQTQNQSAGTAGTSKQETPGDKGSPTSQVNSTPTVLRAGNLSAQGAANLTLKKGDGSADRGSTLAAPGLGVTPKVEGSIRSPQGGNTTTVQGSTPAPQEGKPPVPGSSSAPQEGRSPMPGGSLSIPGSSPAPQGNGSSTVNYAGNQPNQNAGTLKTPGETPQPSVTKASYTAAPNSADGKYQFGGKEPTGLKNAVGSTVQSPRGITSPKSTTGGGTNFLPTAVKKDDLPQNIGTSPKPPVPIKNDDILNSNNLPGVDRPTTTKSLPQKDNNTERKGMIIPSRAPSTTTTTSSSLPGNEIFDSGEIGDQDRLWGLGNAGGIRRPFPDLHGQFLEPPKKTEGQLEPVIPPDGGQLEPVIPPDGGQLEPVIPPDGVQTLNNVKPYNYKDDSAPSGHFMAYFITAIVLCVAGYVIYHNKQKIFAIALEGRRENGRRRPTSGNGSGSGAKYSKLQSSVEEVVPALEKSTTSKNYIY